MPGAGAHSDRTVIGNRRQGMNDTIGGIGTVVGLTKGIATRSATGGVRSYSRLLYAFRISYVLAISGTRVDRRSGCSLTVESSKL